MLAAAACSPAEPPSILDDAAIVPVPVYLAGQASGGDLPAPRDWIPFDLSVSPVGALWAIQRLPRDPRFTDQTECTSASRTGAPNDCGGLIGSTVAIADPFAAEPATADNGGAWEVVDFNAWHFLRRPSAIVFGAPEAWIEADDPGARDPDSGQSTLDGPTMYPDTFVTCSEHFTGNFTDQGPFNGPTLWTADPDIYNGENGPYSWSNGSHLDMVQATSYCMGAAWDADNAYWVFNGELGTIDHYDFGAPHVPGHFYHMDTALQRFDLGNLRLTRAPDVPSNLLVVGADLWIADSGGGRIVRMDTQAPGTDAGAFFSAEGIQGTVRSDLGTAVVVGEDALRAAWGVDPVPAGLALLDDATIVVGSATTGHLTLVDRAGVALRTIDTGLGAGLGGLAVIDGTIFAAHREDRRIYRMDLAE